MFIRAFFCPVLFILLAGIAQPQSTPLLCATGAVNPAVRAESISETLGDILLTCSGGAPGSVFTLNLSIFLNVSITNRISATNATDVSLTVDSGSGPVPASVPGLLQSSSAVSFNGVTFTVPASGQVNLRISNLRGNITRVGGGFQQPRKSESTAIRLTPPADLPEKGSPYPGPAPYWQPIGIGPLRQEQETTGSNPSSVDSARIALTGRDLWRRRAFQLSHGAAQRKRRDAEGKIRRQL